MNLITEASKIPDEKYHTISIEEEHDNTFTVSASNNHTSCCVNVRSVAIGEESVGVESGNIRLGSAGQMMRINYRDFTDEYGYEEIEITFVDR